MKLKSNFTLAGLGDEFVAVSTDSAADFHGIVKLNKSGAEVFRGLSEGLDEAQVAERLMEKYGLDEETARKAVSIVVDKLSAEGLMVE